MSEYKLVDFPVPAFSYWLNTKQKRVFLLADCPGVYDEKEIDNVYVRLQDWRNTTQLIRVKVKDFLALLEIKALIPYTPKIL